MNNSKNILTLKEKIKHISEPQLIPITKNTYETLDDFWDNFIKPLLPQKDTVLKWHAIIKKYVNDDSPVFAIRTYHNWTDKNHNNKELRRGFYTIVDNLDYSFFFTDNFFVAYFEKMVLDNYVPEYDEFKEMMKNHQFPARYWKASCEEKEKALYNINAQNPGFMKHKYKISHIIDVGDNYWIGNEKKSIKKICNEYNLRGDYLDWKNESKSINDKYFVRHITINDSNPKLKEIFKEHFLRFVDPLNYILTPSKSIQIFTNSKIAHNDIGEYDNFKEYTKNKFKEIYGDIYIDYLNMLHYKEPETMGKIKINLQINP